MRLYCSFIYHIYCKYNYEMNVNYIRFFHRLIRQ